MTAVAGIVLSLVTLGILLHHLWKHHTEAKKKRVLDGFPEREKLAAEYGRLVGYPTQAPVDNDLIEVYLPSNAGIEYLTPEQVQDKITQAKAGGYDMLVKENKELRAGRDELIKQVQILSTPVTGHDVRYSISMTTAPNKKRKKKK